VETEQQLEALRQVGCDRVQGYLTGEPIPADDVSRLLGHPRSFSFPSAAAQVDSSRQVHRRVSFATN
jgi:predicted signal transduction protein with EAL and GGDEF domain